MKKNKHVIITIILLLIIISILLMLKNNKAEKNTNQIIPQEEISEDQERETMILLYFENKETKELSKEVRIVDAKILINNPYKAIIEMLISGPKSDKLNSVIPKDTKINDVYIKGNVVYLDLSKEFIENHIGGIENENKTIYAITNTLCELNEVTFVRFLIDGEENKEFKDAKINFKENFEKNN